MTEPKVSERMMKLLTAYVSAAEYTEASEGLGARETKTARRDLLCAIAEIEQRAEALEFLASVVREHYTDIVFPEAEDSANATASDWVTCAINELGNQHKRAEKWKEAAVAYRKWWDAYFEREKHEYPSHYIRKSFDAAQGRLAAALDALGDEWKEATR